MQGFLHSLCNTSTFIVTGTTEFLDHHVMSNVKHNHTNSYCMFLCDFFFLPPTTSFQIYICANRQYRSTEAHTFFFHFHVSHLSFCSQEISPLCFILYFHILKTTMCLMIKRVSVLTTTLCRLSAFTLTNQHPPPLQFLKNCTLRLLQASRNTTM